MYTLGSVLIVDDDPIFRARVVAYYTERHHAHVVEAENGKEAIRVVESTQKQFDLILCDLNMPEVDGIELFGALARARFTGAVAVMSGEILAIIEMAGVLAKHFGLNFVKSIRKPLSTEKLDNLTLEAMAVLDAA